jgi:3'(2'), 5'-bisphosphate nucleotidase
MYNQLNDLIPSLLKIAYVAGDKIMEIYGSGEDFNIETKSDDSPVTKADKASNVIICAGLQELDVNWPIVSEENKAIPFEERNAFEYYWLVDPLDGTKEFIKRNGDFTVNIALIHKNEAILGVVGVPALGEMYWAVKGSGAYMEKEGVASPLKIDSTFDLKDTGLNVVCSRSHVTKPTQEYLDKLNNPNLVPVGSALKFLILAKGDAQLYPRMGPTMEWDIAPAQIVLEEAGGTVIDEESKLPMRYNKENMLNPYFIAYAKKLE